VDYKVSTLQIDLLDGKDGKLVWRGSTERIVNQDNAPNAREAAIRQTVAKILEQYPPR
jgi:predicted secreted protein